MDKIKDLSKKISEILLEESSKNEQSTIITTIEKNLLLSEDLLTELSFIIAKINNEKKENNFSCAIEKLEKFENKYATKLEYIEYIISGFGDVGIKSSASLNRLKHNYYKILNDILSCKSVITQKNLKVIEEKINIFEEKSKSIEEKLEGIGSTVLSTIVSLTVVVTAITAIDRIEARLIPLYLISMVWICMTLIIFINNLFNKSDFNSKQATFLYFIITVLELIILFPSLELIFK